MSRELDAVTGVQLSLLVAQKIMGMDIENYPEHDWKRDKDGLGENEPSSMCVRCFKHAHQWSCSEADMPTPCIPKGVENEVIPFAEVMDDAMDIVYHLGETKALSFSMWHACGISSAMVGYVAAFAQSINPPERNSKEAYFGYSLDSPAEAICRAALMAVAKENEGVAK